MCMSSAEKKEKRKQNKSLAPGIFRPFSGFSSILFIGVSHRAWVVLVIYAEHQSPQVLLLIAHERRKEVLRILIAIGRWR